MRTNPAGLLLLCVACSAGPSAPATLRDGRLQYQAASASGQPLLTGSLQLVFPDDSTVAGSWSIRWAPGADTTGAVGPQIGTGLLAGHRQGDRLVIELNPGSADNNVGLTATATPDGWRGEWEWVALTGPRSRGSFTAARIGREP